MLILVVEDDDFARSALERVLLQAGYQVCWSSTGEGALRLLRSERPSLMLLDMILPDISGWEVRRQQLLDPTIASIPVIIASALSADDVRRVSTINPLSLVQLILSKPIDVSQLLKAIGHIAGLQEITET